MADSANTRAATIKRVVAASVGIALLCVSVLCFRKAIILADQEWLQIWYTGRRVSFGDADSSVLALVTRSTTLGAIPAVISIVIFARLWRKRNS